MRAALATVGLSLLLVPGLQGQYSLEGSLDDILAFAEMADTCKQRSPSFAALLADISSDFPADITNPGGTAFVVALERGAFYLPAWPRPQRISVPSRRTRLGQTVEVVIPAVVFFRSRYALDLDDIEAHPQILGTTGTFRFPVGTERWAISRCEVLGHELAEALDGYQYGFDWNRNHQAALETEAKIRTDFGSPGLRTMESKRPHAGHEDVVIPVGNGRFVVWHTDGANIMDITYR